MADKQFLLRVAEHPAGGYDARCEPLATPAHPLYVNRAGESFQGHASTALGALVAALMNSQVQDLRDRARAHQREDGRA